MKFRNLLAMGAVVACGLTLAACGGNNNSQGAGTSTGGNSQTGNTETVSVHTGIGYSASYDAGQFNVTTAMVAFDATTGNVVKSRVDVVQVKVAVDANEPKVVVTNPGVREDGMPKTKLELGTAYGMQGASAGLGVISGGAEVDVQIESYAAWTQGKSVQQIKDAMVVVTGDSENGYSDGRTHMHGGVFTNDPALWATCTITVDGFAAAIESAYANKTSVAVEVAKDFTVGVAVNAAMYSANELSVNLGGAVVANGKVAAAAIDEVVCAFKATTENRVVTAVTTDLDENAKYHAGTTETAQVFKSKKVLKEAYAMAGKNGGYNSAVTLEWFEQAAIVELACAGKSAAEIAQLVKQEKPWDDTDTQEAGTVVTGATMNINLYTTAVKRAAEYAQKVGLISPRA